MTWFRVDDSFSDHAKVVALLEMRNGLRAVGLWTLSGSWSSKHERDGFVPSTMIKRLGGTNAEASALVDVGLWIAEGAGYRFHGWSKRNPLKSALEERRNGVAERQRRHRTKVSNPLHNDDVTRDMIDDVTRDEKVVQRVVTHSQTLPRPFPDPSQSQRERESARPAAAEPPPGVRILELESRYREGVCAEVRKACALSRRNGKMADSVWLQTLEALAAHELGHAQGAMETFAGRYADGEKDERYLLGICRGNAKGERQGGFAGKSGKVRPSPGTTSADFEGFGTVEEQLARVGM